MPFAFLGDIEDGNENTELRSLASYYVNIHDENLKEYHKHLRIVHLNIRSMISTFIVSLLETRLRVNKYLLDYVKIPGYDFLYQNGEQKFGGEIGAYVREKLIFKISEDLTRLDTTIEQLQLEIKGKNK